MLSKQGVVAALCFRAVRLRKELAEALSERRLAEVIP